MVSSMASSDLDASSDSTDAEDSVIELNDPELSLLDDPELRALLREEILESTQKDDAPWGRLWRRTKKQKRGQRNGDGAVPH